MGFPARVRISQVSLFPIGGFSTAELSGEVGLMGASKDGERWDWNRGSMGK